MDKKIKRIRTIKNVFTIGTILLLIIKIKYLIIPDPKLIVDEAIHASLKGIFTILKTLRE